MNGSTATFHPKIAESSPGLACAKSLWDRGARELQRRTGNARESGAFLLGKKEAKTRRILRFVYYDDLDPHCFDRGIVEFDGGQYGSLWNICRDEGLEVVADVHVHALGFGQSPSDREHPMMPLAGHLAVILSHYALNNVLPGHIGLYEYQGNHHWTDHSLEGPRYFRLDPS